LSDRRKPKRGEKKDKENHRVNKGNKKAAGKSNARKMTIIGIPKSLSRKTTQRRKACDKLVLKLYLSVRGVGKMKKTHIQTHQTSNQRPRFRSFPGGREKKKKKKQRKSKEIFQMRKRH
jgi:hypothetical protein